MSDLWKDLRIAVRGFRRTPVFTGVAVMTLALGIGANTAIFSVVRGVLLRPLPYEDPHELMLIWGELNARDVKDWTHSPLDYRDYREGATLFEDFAAFVSFNQTLTGDGDPERIAVAAVTDNFFSLLGTAPVYGRSFEPEDGTVFVAPPDNPNAAPPPTSAILSHGLWERRFGSDPSVVGRTIDVNGNPTLVVGVMPTDFRLLMPASAAVADDIAMWTALRLNYDNAQRGNVGFLVLGRVKDGVTRAQAQAELDGIATRMRNEIQLYDNVGFGLEVIPLHEDLTETVRPVILALMGAVGFVLLIACANVANLLLVRASGRSREITIRAALGGSRVRLIRQMLIESVVLSAAGALAGLALAEGGVQLLVLLRPADLPRLDTVSIDGAVLAFTVGASLFAALVFGLLPALQASRANLTDALKARSDAASTATQRRVRSAMVITEVALSLVLLIGAGLMIRTFVALQRVHPGFNPDNVLTFQVPFPNGLPTAEQRHGFHLQLKRQFEGLPGVETASAIFPLPLSGQPFDSRYGTEEALEDERQFKQAEYRIILPDYFQAMQTSLIAGRTFTLADHADSLPIVMIDEVLARKTWPGESPIGKRILVRSFTPTPFFVEVVGMVEHQRHVSLAEEGRETVYFADKFFGAFLGMTWTVRTSNDPLSIVSAVRAEVAKVDPTIPVSDVRTMRSYVDQAQAPTQFSLILIGVFAATALALASVGLFGVLAFVVRQRTAEIGVRMAFGAEPARIVKLVVKQGLSLVGVGLVLGIVTALVFTRVMSSMLVGVTPTDPLTFAGVAVVFVLVAGAASTIPAIRATHIDPATALREE